MAISSTVAKKLCTKAEFALFSESLARNIKQLDTNATKARIPRARKLRNKYKGLADRQDREARGKQQARRRNPAKGSVPTRKKEQLFGETLQRLESHLTKLKAKPKKVAKKKPATKKAVKKKPVKKKTATKKTVTKKAPKKTATKKKVAKKKAVRLKEKPADSASVKKKSTKNAKGPAAAARKLRIEKHVSSRNRRNQARRDKR